MGEKDFEFKRLVPSLVRAAKRLMPATKEKICLKRFYTTKTEL